MCQNTEKYIDSATPRAGVSVDRREWNEVLIIHDPRQSSSTLSTMQMHRNEPFTLQVHYMNNRVSDCSQTAPLALLSTAVPSQPISCCALNRFEPAKVQSWDRLECARGRASRHRAGQSAGSDR